MKLSTLILIILLNAGFASGNAIDSLFQKGNGFYRQKRYNDAIECYKTIIKAGKESAPLYYNLGNSYFKTGEIALSILSFEKALKIAPDDQDIIYNLSIANSRITDKIDALPDLFFITWFKNARNTFKADTWSLMSIVTFLLLLITVLGFLLLQSISLRKISATLAVLSLFAFVIFLVFAVSSNSARKDDSRAIIMAPSVIVKSSPDETATDLFVIHEGTKVTIMESFENWSEVQISDGNRGWIVSENYEVI